MSRTMIVLMMLAVVFVTSCAERDACEFPVLTGDYLGQPPPGDEPTLFAPGIVTTGWHDRDVAISPDGDEIYFCAAVGGFSYTAILVSKRIDGQWTEPEVAPFSRNPAWMDLEPCISPDGQRFFFLSNRPDGDEEAEDEDIWVMERDGDHWSEPYNLGPPVNSDGSEFFPSVTRNGTLYFTRSDPKTRVHAIWRSHYVDGAYQEPEQLGDVVNSGSAQFNAFIAQDESYLIVPTVGRPDSRGGTDYYICFRDEQDNWSGPVNLGDRVNTEGGVEYSPYVSPDGKYFFFMSSRTDEDATIPGGELTRDGLFSLHDAPRNGSSDIYWIDAAFLAELRPD